MTTPLLRQYGVSDIHLDSIAVDDLGFLQTSPEYAMKILLANYGCSIFQICPAFRAAETGRYHRTEFQMLEWYRCEFNLADLADDLTALLQVVHRQLATRYPLATSFEDIRRLTYQELFQAHHQINPHTASVASLKKRMTKATSSHLGPQAMAGDYLDVLWNDVEKSLQTPTIVTGFPACQVALAETHTQENGQRVSTRFEFYAGGLELANAYQELRDPVELERRFAENRDIRRRLGKPDMADDPDLLAALSQMPRCSGIALGIDRLAMLLLGKENIAEVLPAE